jgi:hypothetical protein
MTTAVYPASRVKRYRRTNAELDAIDEAIINIVEAEAPGLIPKTEAAYDLIGRQLLKLRRAGRIPYDQITDGTRYVLRPTTHSRLDRMLRNAAQSYRRALWDNQDMEVQIFVEKDAISGVVSEVTEEWDVPLAVVRGYASESFAYTLAESVQEAGKPVFIYQLGDHDPSGLDAWRDLQRKVRAFAPDAEVIFERLAVTPEQIVELSLPTRPTKQTDSRASRFEGESVEVDAIPSTVLRSLVREAIVQHIDEDQFDITLAAEQSERAILSRMAMGLAS